MSLFGFSELLVILVIAVVIIPAKDLPKILRTLAAFWRKVTQLTRDLESKCQDWLSPSAKPSKETPYPPLHVKGAPIPIALWREVSLEGEQENTPPHNSPKKKKTHARKPHKPTNRKKRSPARPHRSSHH